MSDESVVAVRRSISLPALMSVCIAGSARVSRPQPIRYGGEGLPNGEEQLKSPPKVTSFQTERPITPAQLRYLKRLIEAAKPSEEHIKNCFNLDR